jgi:hypothetical protein
MKRAWEQIIRFVSYMAAARITDPTDHFGDFVDFLAHTLC